MFVSISNNLIIKNPTSEVINYCKKELILPNPDYYIAEKLGRNTRWLNKTLDLYITDGNDLILPFGCLDPIWKLTGGFTFELRFNKMRFNNLKGNYELYDYQKKALNKLIYAKNGVLEAPCGSGKTQIGLAFIESIGGKALWLTHTKDLLMQSMNRAKSLFKSGDYGTITEGKVNIGKDITFATVQTVSKLDPSIYKEAFDVVVVDECHHAAGSPTKVKQFYKVINNINCRYKIGLSATLTRSDGLIKSVYALLGPVIYKINESEVASKIIKANHIKVEWNKEYKISDYSQTDGMLDYAKLIDLLSNDTERNEFIAQNILINHYRNQLVLCSRISQVDALYELCKNNELDVVKITSKVRLEKRCFSHKVIIATYQLAREGLDIPTLDVVHFATPQKDKAVVKQSAGRVERYVEGKDTPLVIDYVDNKIAYCMHCFNKRKRLLK